MLRLALVVLLNLAGLAMAAPAPANITIFSPQANILRMMPSDYVVTSATLYEYLKTNSGANHTIYVRDTGKFINMGDVKPGISKRQGPGNPCFGYNHYWAKQTQQWWSPWVPVSGCLYTGLDPKGGSQTIDWQFSLSISENAGLSWSIIKDVLSFSAGITATETWSHGESYKCDVPPNSVGQIFLQNKIVWGWIWSEGCQSCNVGGNHCLDAKPNGGALAPAASTVDGVGVNPGCSTGYSNVQCG